MQLDKEINNAKFQITRYTASSVTVNDQEFTASILIMPEYVAPWPVTNIQALTAQDLEAILALNPEIILLGTGPHTLFPDPAILQRIFKQHIGLEVMTTPAACRTYAALTSEGRNVVAALVIA